MSGVTRLPVMAGTLSVGAFIAALTALPSVRQAFSQYLGKSVAGSIGKAFVLLWAIANLKNLPFIWHYRVLKGIFYQLYFQPQQYAPKHLFAPMITSSYNTLYDTDYNFHKSNSTYFADLDVSRANACAAIIRVGMKRLNSGDEEGLSQDILKMKGKYIIALGGVACHFAKEIPPMAGFEIWTRVLSWDRKWLYLVSHIVKKGVMKPESYALQPWKKGKKRSQVEGQQKEDFTKHIYATSIARYVLKKGRLTISPEVILERSRLLPKRPQGVGLPPRAESVTPTSGSADASTPALQADGNQLSSPESVAAELTSRLDGSAEIKKGAVEEDADWTWDDMEAERLRGLKIASHFDALSGLHGELRNGEALGEYSDWF